MRRGIANGKSSSGFLSHLGGPNSLPQSKVLPGRYRYTFWCSQSGICFSRLSFFQFGHGAGALLILWEISESKLEFIWR